MAAAQSLGADSKYSSLSLNDPHSVTNWINSTFPDEASLGKLDDEIAQLKAHIAVLDKSVVTSVIEQSSAAEKGKQDLALARASIAELRQKMASVFTETVSAEKQLRGLTDTLKPLDNAKQHLTSSITALTRLQSIFNAVNQLPTLIDQRKYSEVSARILMVNKLLTQFDSYTDVPQLSRLRKDFDSLKHTAQETVVNDFRTLEVNAMDEAKNRSLNDGCMVLDALGEVARNGFVNEFAEKQLLNYNKEFGAQSDQKGEKVPNPKFKGIVSQAFDDFLPVYTKQVDSDMQKMFEQALMEETWKVTADNSNKVLASARDMVFYFSTARQQCIELSTGRVYFDLFVLLQKFLGLYAAKIREKLRLAQQAVATGGPGLTDEQSTLLCILINTSDYLTNLAREMETNMKGDIDEVFKERVSFNETANTYQSILADCVSTVISHLSLILNPAFSSLSSSRWEKIDHVSDQSEYVTLITSELEDFMPVYRENIAAETVGGGANAAAPQHFAFFCESVSNHVSALFNAEVKKLRGVSEIGAEQLLLDSANIKHVLAKATNPNRTGPPNERYIKRVERKLQSVEKLLQLLLTPMDALSDTFRTVFPEQSAEDFINFLDMKGVKKAKQLELIEAFGLKQDHPLRTTLRQAAESEELTMGLNERVKSVKGFFNL